jgi:hypothetical protein
VAFGDVNLQTDPVRGKYAGSPGGGGWPTIRYYNKGTGYDGKFAGEWKDANKLEGAMCDVFGKDENLQRYVEEMGSTSLCSVPEGAGCTEKELEFISKWKDLPKADVDAQHTRLKGMASGSMKPELKKWLGQRLAILSQLKAKDEL